MKFIGDITLHLLLVACLVTSVRAWEWDDFTNNLATDLTPLIALFGEKTSTQFLSESTTILDNFLFAMAPLGILTGVVSAIRVCGGPSLRAFIGRAQEGGGVAEAELCSSTSRDVCELYHNGAIIRAFGRPKILEVVFDPNHNDADPKTQPASDKKPTYGIFPSREYFQEKNLRDWDEHPGRKPRGDEEATKNSQLSEASRDTFAPNPNLSLNIGITKRSELIRWAAAGVGFLAQSSVLLFGAVVQYHLQWTKDENPVEVWAFPFTLGGTLCVCGGMFLCAFLVNDSTKERKFRRRNTIQDMQDPTLYVVQPGNQVIGDQTFDPFLFSSSKQLPWTDYITSWKKPAIQAPKFVLTRGLLQKPSPETFTLIATSITMIGFVFQFIGLRAMHSAVSLLQLGVTIGMGIVRALLRTQRLRPEQNLLRDRPDEVSGHELDWLALQIGKEPNDPRYSWCITNDAAIDTPKQADSEKTAITTQTITNESPYRAQSVFNYRTRLAELTKQMAQTKLKVSSAWDDGLIIGRSQAQQLSKAIGTTLDILSTSSDFKLEMVGPQNIETIQWKLSTEMWKSNESQAPQASDIYISIRKKELGWMIDPDSLEAIIGLFSWSINSDPCTEEETFGLKTSIAAEIPMYRIISVGTEDEVKRQRQGLQLWMENIPLTSSVTAKTISSLDSLKPSLTTIWNLLSSNIEPCKTQIPHEAFHSGIYGRLAGWQSTNLREKDSISMVKLASTSIPTICSQEIYQSFLRSVSKHVKFDKKQVKVIKEDDRFRLEHQSVTKLIDCFETSGLGTNQDAYLTIIPALEHDSRLPRVNESIPAAHRTAEHFRKSRRFQEAEALLYWTWEATTIRDEYKETTMVEIGELYRCALFSEEVSMQAFGRNGIDWMSKQVHTSSLKDIYDRYFPLRDAQSQESRTGNDIIEAIQKQDRTDTLLSLSLLKDKNLSSSKEGRTVLSFAAEKGWHEVVKATLEIGCVVDSQDNNGRTPLSYAAENGHTLVVQILMEAKALPVLEDSSRSTPLKYASINGHVPVMEALLTDPRVNVYTKDNDGRSLLHEPASRGEHDAIRCLCKHGAPINDPDRGGYTPLILALINNRRYKTARFQTANVILEAKAMLDITIQGKEAWRWAIEEGEWTCAEFLLKHDETKAHIDAVLSYPRNEVAVGTKAEDVKLEVRIRAFGQAGREKSNMGLLNEVAADPSKVEVRCMEGKNQTNIKCKKPFRFLNGIMDQFKPEITIDDELLAKATQSPYCIEALSLFLDRPEEAIAGEKVMDGILKPFKELYTSLRYNAESMKHMENILRRIFDRSKQVVVTELMTRAMSNSEPFETLFLSWRGKVTITGEAVEEVIRSADWRGENNTLLNTFLDRQAPITEEALELAAKLHRQGRRILELLLDRRGEEVIITEKAVEAAVYNDRSGLDILKLLLDRRGEQVPITEKAVEAALRNNGWGLDVLKLLLDRRGEQVPTK